MTVDDGRLVTVGEAALTVGVRERRLRRWIAAGRVSAVRGSRGQLVELAEVRAAAEAATDGHLTVDDGHPVTVRRSAGDGHPAGVDLAPLVALIEKQERTILELSGRVGWLQARNEDLQGRLKQLTEGGVDAPNSVSAIAESRRPQRVFWRRVLGFGFGR